MVLQAAAPIVGLLPAGADGLDNLKTRCVLICPAFPSESPALQTEVRVYGFAKASGYSDFGPRNQNNAPAPQTIPLADSPAALQGGDMGMTARFSRIGLDTRTLTGLGTLETRIEGDFGGGAGGLQQFYFPASTSLG